MNALEKLLTIREVADLLGIKPDTVYQMTYRRELPFYKIGRQTRFAPSDIEAYLAERRDNAQGEDAKE